MPKESTTRHTWTAGVHPGIPGPGQNSLMVRLDVGGVVVVATGRSDVPLQSTKTEGKNKGGVYAGLPLPQQVAVQYTRSRPLVGPKPPGGGDRTRRRPLLASEAMGRSRRAVMLLVVGGGVMMVGRAPTDLVEGGQSTAGEGAGITQGNA